MLIFKAKKIEFKLKTINKIGVSVYSNEEFEFIIRETDIDFVQLPFNLLDYPEAGIITIGLIGLLFIVTRAYWVNKLIEQFQEKRYTIAQGFRNE